MRRGEDVETMSLLHLQAQGLKLIEKNFRSTYGELDLVMLDDQDLVFVEVRYRKNDDFGGASESVNERKKRKLRRTAESFLQQDRLPEFVSCRFDVVAVKGEFQNYEIDWIQDAF